VGSSGSYSYSYQVRACNTGGCSGWKAGSAVSVTIPPASAPGLSLPSSSNGSYTVSWTGVSGATSYTLQEQINGGGWSTVQTSGATSWGASGKANQTTYGYRVQACNVGGCGPWSGTGSITVILVPDVPTGAYVEDHVGGKLESSIAHWNTVTGATSYQAIRNDTGASVYNSTGTQFTEGSAFIPNMPLYYPFSVKACNANGCSGWAVGN
jgi:hypothetical protein